MNKAVVIMSGGQDSATCLFWAKKQYRAVYAITFKYGQRHEVEIACAEQICKENAIPHIVIQIPDLSLILKSALLNKEDSVNKLNEKELPSSFVPNRNALFITLAHAYAQTIGAQYLVGGMCETDFSGYPDCRKNFIDSMESALNLGSNSYIHIDTPLMYLNKAQTFKLASDLGYLSDIVHKTHTCYEGNHNTLHEWGYGCSKQLADGTYEECPACKLRRKGYEEFTTSKKKA